MEANVEELKEWSNVAKRGLRQAIERLEEREEQISSYMKVLDAVEELLAKINDLKEEAERKQTEIDELEEQLEQKQQEADDLRRQLLEAQNHQLESEKQRLESEKQQLEAEASAKPMEIHNHFGSGCSAQVFNDKVTGKFTKTKKRKWKRIIRKNMECNITGCVFAMPGSTVTQQQASADSTAMDCEQPEVSDDEEEGSEELCHFIHPSVDSRQEWQVHNEVKRLASRQGIQDICRHLQQMRRENKLLLPQSPSIAYEELVRMGMPSGNGFNESTFRKYYSNK